MSTSTTSPPKPPKSSTTITDAPHQRQGDSTRTVSGNAGTGHFTWTKTADQILERLNSYLQRIPGAGHSKVLVHSSNLDHLMPSAPSPTNVRALRVAARYAGEHPRGR